MIMSKTGADKMLAHRNIAVLTATGFNEFEMTQIQRTLNEHGGAVRIISPDAGLVNGWNGKGWGHFFPVDQALPTALAADFDLLIVPGGARAIEKLKQTAHSARFIHGFVLARKPMAVINEGVDLLIHAKQVKGFTIACSDQQKEAVVQNGGQLCEQSAIISRFIISGKATPETIRALIEDTVEHFASFQDDNNTLLQTAA